MADDVSLQERLTQALKKLLNAADGRLLAAQDEGAALVISKETHEQVASLLLEYRRNHDVDNPSLSTALKSALCGLETAVPVPPLPEKPPLHAEPMEPSDPPQPAAAPKPGTDFEWRFLRCGHDVVSVLQARFD